MKKYFLNFEILSFGIIFSVLLVQSALAQIDSDVADAADIQYPVTELGNCENQDACRTYCDESENLKPCLAFAEKNNLMTEEELKIANNFANAGGKGPGGCNGKDSCDEYCDDVANIDECVSFAEKNNLMPKEDLEEAKKVQAAIKKGVKPPACKNKQECDTYCGNPDNMEECINFAIEAGFMSDEEKEQSQKVLTALKRGVKPPACNGKEECDVYCQSPDNMEECINFALEAGMMDENQKQDSQKMLKAIKKGVKPPACNGKEECDVYCQSEEHMQECVDFSVAAGFMNEKEAEMIKKTGGKGPGGCKGKEECETFCDNPDNQETCFQFGKDNGLIPEKDLEKMEQGKQQFKQSLEQTPTEVMDCLNSSVGSDQMEKFKNGTAMPPKEMGDKMKNCFDQVLGPPPDQQEQQNSQEQPCDGENCQDFQSVPQGKPSLEQQGGMAPGTFKSSPDNGELNDQQFIQEFEGQFQTCQGDECQKIQNKIMNPDDDQNSFQDNLKDLQDFIVQPDQGESGQMMQFEQPLNQTLPKDMSFNQIKDQQTPVQGKSGDGGFVPGLQQQMQQGEFQQPMTQPQQFQPQPTQTTP